MAERKTIQDDKDFVSDRISAQVRTLAVSFIAVVWLFLVEGKEAPILQVNPNKILLLCALTASLFALVADYLQYVCGYLTSAQVLRKGPDPTTSQFTYDYGAIAYRARLWLFWAKQALLLVAFAALAVALTAAALGC